MKKLLSLIAAIFITAATFAQDEVTLTVIGTGENEEKATLQALRSAIEQTFGAFVSANTTILNDKLVQDEIVSISTGNVTKYEKNAVVTLPNGHVSVSLNATIAINKLISYAQSKGAKAEFAGATYATNAKLLRLKIQSIEKAYEIMVQQMEQIAPEMFTFKLTLGEPQRQSNKYAFDCVIEIFSNIASHNFRLLFLNTMKEFVLNENEIKFCHQEEIPLSNYNSKSGAYTSSSGEVIPKFDITLIKRINSAVTQAVRRYKIQEINNPKNVFIPIEGCGFYLSRPIKINNSMLWPISISSKSVGLNSLQVMLYVTPLEKGHKKELEHQGITGVTHEATVCANMEEKHSFTLTIPINDMPHFQGFELINVSAPNEKFYVTLPKKYRKETRRMRPEDL